MAWYYGTYSCGHEGRINVVGPAKERQWQIDKSFEGLCSECYKEYLAKKRERQNKEAEEKTKEMNLVELIGTEKQIAWANTIRLSMIKMFEQFENGAPTNEYKNLYNDFMDAINIENRAKWWIENRADRLNIIEFVELMDKYISEVSPRIQVKKENKDKSIIETKAESTVAPENKKFEGTVEIINKNGTIFAKYEKNDKFIEIVKRLGYRWDGAWKRCISTTSGPIEDRMAELGNILLNEGFAITIYDEEIRNKAINGTFEPECTRWIMRRAEGEYKNWLAINWCEDNDKLYQAARKITGSKWSKPSVVVKVDYYKELEDFAEQFGFKFSEKSLEIISTYKEAEKKTNVVNPVTVEHQEKDGLNDILNSSTEVLEELKDDH